MIFLNALVSLKDKSDIEKKLGIAAYMDLMQWINYYCIIKDLQSSNAQYSAAHLLFCETAYYFKSALTVQNLALINDNIYQLINVLA